MTLRHLAGPALLLTLCACFNDSSYAPAVLGVTAPLASPVVPNQILDGTTQLTVAGRFFTPGTVIFWNGKPQATTITSGGQAQVTLDDGLTDKLGPAVLTAEGADGLPSRPLTLIVVTGTPKLTSISPQQAPAGSAGLTLTVKGVSFDPGAQVLWNGTPLQTTAVSAIALTAVVPASLLAFAGDGFVQVSSRCGPFTFECPTLTAGAIFSVGTSTRATVQTGAFDLAWDAVHGRLYGSPVVVPNQLAPMVAIDPAAATAVPVKNVFARLHLSISDQDQFLYTDSGAGGLHAMRYTLPDFTGDTALTTFPTLGVAAAPGAPATAAVFDTTFNQAEVLDGTTVRPKTAHTFAGPDLAWGSDASTLYVTDSNGLERFTVDSTGLTSSTLVSTNSGIGFRIFFDAPSRHLHGDGSVILDEQGALVATVALPLTAGGGAFCVSTAQTALDDRIFYACSEPNTGLTVRSFDALSGRSVTQVMLVPVVPTAFSPAAVPPRVNAIARFGNDGLAVATDTAVYLYNGAFIH